MAQTPNNTVVVRPDDIPYFSAVSQFNAKFKVILRGNQTSNLLTIVDDLIYNSAASRNQIHIREDITFYVLNGSLQFDLNGYQLCAPTGTIVYVPRNVSQSQRTLGSKPVHVLILLTPSGLEHYHDQIETYLTEQPTNQTVADAIALANGVTVLPEVTWKDLGCAFDDGALFSLSFHLTFLIISLYVLIFFC